MASPVTGAEEPQSRHAAQLAVLADALRAGANTPKSKAMVKAVVGAFHARALRLSAQARLQRGASAHALASEARRSFALANAAARIAAQAARQDDPTPADDQA